MRAMNIVFILTRSDTVGGVQNHVVEIAAALIEEGHQVTVLCGGDGQYFEKLERYGVPHHRVSALSNTLSLVADWRAYQEISEILRTLKPDIVSTHSTKAGMVGRLASRRLNIPVLFTAHGWAFTEGVAPLKRKLYRLLEYWLSGKSDKIICVSEYDRQLGIQAKIPESILCTIHNGRHDEFDELISAPHNDIPVIVMIGRLDTQKDHECLFQALSVIREEYPFRLVLLGDGPKLILYRDMVSDLGLADRVEFKGLVKTVHQELRKADLFTLITHYEGFPRSTLEAMCAGLPVVVSNAGGSAEAVQVGINGFVVERGDVSGLVDVLRKLLADKALRASMSQQSRSLFLERFTFDKMYKQTKKQYEALLSTR